MMNDTIYRQAAIDALDGNVIVTSKESAQAVMDYIRGCADRIRSLPSAQPEIIRCKDCKHGIDYYHEGDCYCSNPKLGLEYFGGSWEFYCADAERRTDDGE